jgi:hypothetical protein
VVAGVLYPLMARAGALAEVDSVLAAARAGRGTLVAVTGEPGIGKTRLAEAAADRAALAGPARDPGGGPADPEGARSQLSFDLAEVIAAAAQPVLVVIDDAHQADPSSLRLLAELGPALRAMPAAVLVTARDGDPARRAPRPATPRPGTGHGSASAAAGR